MIKLKTLILCPNNLFQKEFMENHKTYKIVQTSYIVTTNNMSFNIQNIKVVCFKGFSFKNSLSKWGLKLVLYLLKQPLHHSKTITIIL